MVADIMRLQLRPIAVEQGVLRYSRPAEFRDDIGPHLREALRQATGIRWTLDEQPDGGAPTLSEREQSEREEAQQRRLSHPLIAAAFAAFPEAELIEDSEAPTRRAGQWRREA